MRFRFSKHLDTISKIQQEFIFMNIEHNLMNLLINNAINVPILRQPPNQKFHSFFLLINFEKLHSESEMIFIVVYYINFNTYILKIVTEGNPILD